MLPLLTAYVDAEHEACRVAKRKNASEYEITRAKHRSRLMHLRILHHIRLAEIEIPEGGFETREQYHAAAALASTYRDLRRLEDELDEKPRTPRDPLVTSANSAAMAFYRTRGPTRSQ